MLEPAATSPRPRRRTLLLVVAAILFLGGLAFRVAVVETWHAPAGDGTQYHKLAQELRAHGRFAFGPEPTPLSYARMPGYPLFLAYVAVREAPLDLVSHVRRATRANVLLDLGTALLVVLLIGELSGRRRLGGAALLGFALTVVCPLLVLLASFALTETLATFLATAMIYLALRVRGRGAWIWAVLLGLVSGFALLVRFDAVTTLPAVALAILLGDGSLRRRLGAIAVVFAVAGALFAPWPIRNLQRFGEAHVTSHYWRTMDGRPLPLEPIAWARTWGSSALGESYLDMAFAFDMAVDPNRPGIVLPAMYDDEAERRRVAAVFDRYNRERWSPAVREELARLAAERGARAPLRTYVVLPLRRLAHLWSPVPEHELPMRVPWLGLPAGRPWFLAFDLGLFAAALLGAAVLFRRGALARRHLAVLLLPVLGRSALFCYAVAVGVTERYLIEVFPLFVVLAAIGLATVVGGLRRRRDEPRAAVAAAAPPPESPLLNAGSGAPPPR